MSTFACHCGTGTITGTYVANPDRENQPDCTFACGDHFSSGARTLATLIVRGNPGDIEAFMAAHKDMIDFNAQWLVDNPAGVLAFAAQC